MSFTRPVDNRWIVGREIAAGYSSQVYEGRDRSGSEVVIKINRGPREGFRRETELYQTMGRPSGFPKVYFSGNHEGKQVLVMQKFEYTLKDLHQQRIARFTRNDVLKIGIQMLNRIAVLHTYGYVHRDIHPGNIMMSNLQSRTLYLIDFGCTKKFKNDFGFHVLKHKASTIPVTFKFGSVNALQGYSASRRDDLEGLLYTLIALQTGTLPWSDIDGQTNLEEILNMKEEIPSRELCCGVSSSILSIARKIRALGYSEEPLYYEYCAILRAALQAARSSEREPFSWQS